MYQQTHLPLDATQLFELQHSTHRSSLATLAGNDGDLKTVRRPHFHHKAVEEIEHLRQISQFAHVDAYVTQNGIDRLAPGRSVSAMDALTAVWVDLDYYNTEYADLSPADLLEEIESALPWLPAPTVITDSGRGCYLHWFFHHHMKAEDKNRWQKLILGLTEALSVYGADTRCAEASRILRICGSMHANTGRTVKSWDTGPSYNFNQLCSIVNKNHWQEVESVAIEHSPRGTVTWLRNGHTRMGRAMADVTTLAQLRAPVIDCRHRMLLAMAMVGSWFCPTNEVMLTELEQLTQYFDPKRKYRPDNLPKILSTVLQKAEDGRAGVVIESGLWAGKNVRYTPSKPYLVDLCEITRKEQQHMSYIFSHAEKLRRYRRKNGKHQEQSVHLAKARKENTKAARNRQAEAVSLHQQGLKRLEIAERMGVNEKTVRRYLKKSGHSI